MIGRAAVPLRTRLLAAPRGTPLLALCIAAAAPAPAAALLTGGRGAEPPCEQGRISYVFIDNRTIFDTADVRLDPRFSRIYEAANALHVRTRPAVIRRELLFRTGDCYDEALLEESARLLRGFDFLAHADIFGIRQPDGTYHVVVDTRDEWSTRLDLGVALDEGLFLDGARLREANLLGTGQAVGLYYRRRDVERDYGVSYETPQLAGTRWDLRAAAGRTRAGTSLDQAVAYPFVGEVGRWAALQAFRQEERFFDYVAEDADGPVHIALPTRDLALDLALLTRIGRPGALTLLGGGLFYRQRGYPGTPERVAGRDFHDRVPVDSALHAAFRARLGELHAVRAGVLIGQRNIWWTQRRGLDALRRAQDVKLGAEAELGLARSLPGLEADDDMFLTLGFYTGLEAGPALVVGRLRGEGRRNLIADAAAPEWEDVLLELEILGYHQPPTLPAHTLMLRLSGIGGWHTRGPFQLTLGGEYGVRGYHRDFGPGGRRLLLTLEDRILFDRNVSRLADLGATAFLDVGRIWAGDAFFGRDTGWRAALGAGLRAAVPAGSRTVYRLDVAVPLHDAAGLRSVRLHLSVGERFGLRHAFSDYQLARSRQAGPTGEILHFPN
jgi:hypothetical protein